MRWERPSPPPRRQIPADFGLPPWRRWRGGGGALAGGGGGGGAGVSVPTKNGGGSGPGGTCRGGGQKLRFALKERHPPIPLITCPDEILIAPSISGAKFARTIA